MPLGPAAQTALLKWVNTFPAGADVSSTADLNDGSILSRLLGDIDSNYSPQALPKVNALQAVVSGLFRYIRTECEGIDALLETSALKSISENSQAGQMFELLVVVLMAAVSGPERENYVMAIQQLEAGVQQEIAKIIQQKQKECESGIAVLSNNKESRSESAEDFELQFEVRYSTLIAQKKTLEQDKEKMLKQMADMTLRLERLQDHNETLLHSLTNAEDKLSGAAKDGDTAAIIKNLESKIREQEELIANQEGQIEQDRSERLRLRKDVERLGNASDRVEQLQDDLKELQYQNLELTKKANTVDRFKQKLETQRDFQEMNKNLEYELEELRAQIKELELLKRRNASLEATHIQFQNTLSKREMEIFEMSNQKKTLEEERVDLQRRINILEDRREHDEEFIKSLQEQVNGKTQSVTSPTEPSGFSSLEDELEQSEALFNRNDFEISRLKAEIQILKGNAGAAQENASLRLKLEDAERARQQLEAKCQDLFDKHVVAEQQVTAILEASTSEGLVQGINAALLLGQLTMLTPEYYSSEAFTTLRKQQQATQEQLSTNAKKLFETEAELESTKRDLVSATSDLSMIAKDDIEALEELKLTQDTIYSSLEAELKALQSRYKALEIDSEQQKAHLVEAILTKDKLMADKSEQVDLLQTHTASETTEAADDIKEQLKEKAEAAWNSLVAAQETVKAQESTMHELRARIMDLETSGSDAQKTILEEQNTNLKRENAMITTAWYDLTTRLQSNIVVLQRRADAPKSWINKQRQAVNNNFKR